MLGTWLSCLLYTAGVFNLLGHAPPHVGLISLAPPPPHYCIHTFTPNYFISININKYPLKLLKPLIIYLLLFLINNLHNKYMDPLYWCIFDIYFTVYVHVQQPTVLTRIPQRSQPAARGLYAARHESECGPPRWMLRSYVFSSVLQLVLVFKFI